MRLNAPGGFRTKIREKQMRPLSWLAVACTFVAATSAHAHVTAQPNSGAAGTYFETFLGVPHGCEGSSTLAVRVKIPAEITGVKAQFKAGWTVTIKNRKLDQPLKGERGQTITETVDEVEWRGGPLPNALYDTFGLRFKLPDQAGQTLYFPVIQECEKGVKRWIQIPAAGQGWHDVPSPAPFVKIVPANSSH